jgi:hypothetical protein
MTQTKENDVFGHKPETGICVATSGEIVPMYNEIANLSGVQISMCTPTSVHNSPIIVSSPTLGFRLYAIYRNACSNFGSGTL